jgi:hypothetical protein
MPLTPIRLIAALLFSHAKSVQLIDHIEGIECRSKAF